MSGYTCKKDFLTALAKTPKGSSRQKLLAENDNRQFIASRGANVTLYSGKPVNIKELNHEDNVSSQLDSVCVGVLMRHNPRTKMFDGLGTWGGLAELTDKQEFAAWSEAERHSWIGLRDDIVVNAEGRAVLTQDSRRITLNNISREAREEMSDLGIYNMALDLDNIQFLDTAEAHDDNYAVNIWDGHGDVRAITPYCCLLQTSESLLDELENKSRECRHSENPEASLYKKVKLTDVLPLWGNQGGYRYPHEWLSTWAIAANMLDHNEKAMCKLVSEVQGKSPHLINFGAAAKSLGQDMKFVGKVLGMSEESVNKMQQSAKTMWQAVTEWNRCQGKV